MQGPVHPQVSVVASWIRKWGKWHLAIFCQLFLLVLVAFVSAFFEFSFYQQIDFSIVNFAVFFTLLFGPFVIFTVFYLVMHLDAALSYLIDSAHQERLLNEGAQENIRQLNFEIEERKKAFQAKRRAIDELRKEISERKKTQLELQEQSLLIRSIVDSSPDLFYYQDETGRFASCNKMFETIMGISMSELIGRTPSELLLTNNAKGDILISQDGLALTASEMTRDVEFIKDDGNVIWYEMRNVPFYDANGRYIGLLGFGRDITSRKLAEQALEKAFLDKGKFIATLSHELRTPLNGVVGLSRRLLETELSTQQHGWVNTIFSSAEALGNIFNDIIDLDKIDRQDLDIVYQSVSLSQFMNDIANFAELLCQQKGLTFKLSSHIQPDLYVKLDATRLRQVLWNLLNNAVKFTAAGSIALQCNYDTNSEKLDFRVQDSGIGIAKNDLERIFDMYYKASEGRRLSLIGSGIGLSVSKALVEAMKGQIGVSSVVGKGSQFNVILPAPLTEKVVPTLFHCPPLTILLVEDVPLNAEIAISLLEQRGHSVIHAETGEDAIALLETEDDIDLVLLDMQLPDMSGDKIARYIREDKRLEALPVVVLSANIRNAESQLNGVKIEGALAKPIDTNKLDFVLAQIFSPSSVKLLQARDVSDDQVLDTFVLNDYIQSLGKVAMKRSSQLFEQLVPVYIDKLMECITRQDEKEFKEAAHKLKGAAASVGLLSVQQVAKQFEIGPVNWDGLEHEIQNLQKKIEQHLAALSDYIENA